MDSGCTEHVMPFQSDFLWYHDFPRPGKAHLASQGKTIDILGHGEVCLKHTTSSRRTVELTLRNVLYIPQAAHRYFAPGVSHKMGKRSDIDSDRWKIMDKDSTSQANRTLVCVEYDPTNRLYWLKADIYHPKPGKPAGNSQHILSATVDNYELWHQRFGYAGKKIIENLPGHVKGVPKKIPAPSTSSPCEGCELGKSKRLPFPPSESRASAPLELVHMDLVDKPSLSIDGFRYEHTLLDDYSSFGIMFYLKHKSNAFCCFKAYKAWAECQTGHQLKCVRSDRGGEFLGKEFDEFLEENGIERQLSIARTPQQNGRAERWQ